jgi:magnesium-transporting ATPase (P-type)
MCFGERKTPVNCITLFSVVVACCSIIMFVFAYLGTQGETMEKIKEAKAMGDLKDVSTLMAVFFFGLAAVILVLSILGFLFRCCTHPCYAWCYGICLFPAWAILLIFGGVAVAWASASEEDLIKFCDDLSDEVAKQNDNDNSYVAVKYDLNIYD